MSDNPPPSDPAGALSDERFNALIAHISDAIALTSADGVIRYASPSATRVLGYDRTENFGRFAFELVHPDDLPGIVRLHEELRREPGGYRTARFRVRHKDGSWRWIDCESTNQLENPQLLGIVSNLRDVTERVDDDLLRREQASRLREALERMQTVLSSITEGYFALDAEFRFVEVNSAAVRMVFRRPASELIGRVYWDVFPRTRASEFLREYRRAAEEQVAVHFEARSEIVDGWFEAHVHPRGGGIEVYIRDITDRKRAEEALRENDRRKDEFLAMLAHELRNPLSAVAGAVETLQNAPEPEARDWAVDVLGRQVHNLARLVDDLVDAARLTQGKIRLQPRRTDARPIIQGAVEVLGSLPASRARTLSLTIAPEPLVVEVDPTRFEQVLVNLLTNAVKYTEPGGSIWLEARRDGPNLAISVRDDGVGIAPESIPRMFELFAQGDDSLARSEGGLGIGLTLARALTELHGGTLTARSDGPGKGSEFVVKVPAAATDPPPWEPTPPQPSTHPESSPPSRPLGRVLVIDDNVDTARALGRFLHHKGFEVALAHDGPTGLAAATAGRPDFVLLDIGLPGMDGLEVARRLRDEPGRAGRRVIGISGHGQDDDRKRSHASGFDHYLVKPIDYEALIRLLTPPPAADP